MRRISFWVLSTLASLVLLFGYHTSTAGTGAASPDSAYVAGVSPSSGTTGGGGDAATSDGTTVTGDAVQTQWGPVQVQLSISGHRITRAAVLQYPTGNSHDAEINDYALPILVQETIDQQSADIDMVSGATVTSTGYLQSLQSALDQAAS